MESGVGETEGDGGRWREMEGDGQGEREVHTANEFSFVQPNFRKQVEKCFGHAVVVVAEN